MRYNEWRDELQNNLFNVSESERRRVLDYYAEAYADRREAGYSERQIIEDFGAPYDAAQRILLNIYDSREEGIEEERYNQFKDNRKSSRYSNERNQNYFEERENPRQNQKSKREPDFVEAEVVREERARKQDSDLRQIVPLKIKIQCQSHEKIILGCLCCFALFLQFLCLHF